VYSSGAAGVNCAAGDRAFFVNQQRVGASFFEVLEIPPAFGRGFTKEEDRENVPRAVVLSDALRRRLFGDAGGVVDQKLLLRGEPYSIVGVMPAGFNSGANADLWTPLKASSRGEGAGSNYQGMARLKPGVSLAAAVGELDNISRTLPVPEAGRDGTVWVPRLKLQPLLEGRTSDLRKPLLLLLGAVVWVSRWRMVTPFAYRGQTGICLPTASSTLTLPSLASRRMAVAVNCLVIDASRKLVLAVILRPVWMSATPSALIRTGLPSRRTRSAEPGSMNASKRLNMVSDILEYHEQ